MAEDRLLSTIANGKTSTQMTGFSVQAGGKLYNSEITAITNYLLTWERFDQSPAIPVRLLRPPAADPTDLQPLGLPKFPPLRGDGEAGRRLFLMVCSSCHGNDRRGFIGPDLLHSWNTVFPELLLKSIVKNGVPGSLMIGNEARTSPLSAKNIDDLLLFLLHQ